MLLFCEFVNLNCAYRCVTVEYELSVMDNLYLLRKVRKPLKLNVERESRSIHMMTYQQSLGLGLGRQLSESIRIQMTVSLAHKISIERHESKRCSMSDTYNDCYWLKSNYYQSAKFGSVVGSVWIVDQYLEAVLDQLRDRQSLLFGFCKAHNQKSREKTLLVFTLLLVS